MINVTDYVDLGMACADICRALNQGMNGRQLNDFGHSVCEVARVGNSSTIPLTAELW